MSYSGDEPPGAWIDVLIARQLAGDDASASRCSSEFGIPEPAVDSVIAKLRRIEAARLRVQRERAGESELIDAELPAIANDFTTLKEIARGGQAVVYLARHNHSGELIALKVLRDRLVNDARRQQRFEAEVRILRGLNHPQIVPLLSSGLTVDGDRFLATRFIDGPMLDPKSLAQTRSGEWRLSIMSSLCRAVHAAHERGIVHRDLKPSNVRFDATGRPVVLDFGLAREISGENLRQSLTTTGEFLGTFLWASPEQAAGATEVSPASDVFSLGVILHQLFADGRFPPQVHASMRSAIESETTPAQRKHRFSRLHDPELEPILRKCLDRVPERRYQTAGALAEALDAHASGTGPRRRPKLWFPFLSFVCFAAMLALLLRQAAAPQPKTETFREISAERTLVNGRPIIRLLGMRFIWCPPGEYVMGATPTESDALPDSRIPRNAVVSKGFYIAQTELRQDVWKQIMKENPSRFVGDSLPVERVSWNMATEFCRRASAETGRKIRLPTEIEWEYACRAGTRLIYFWGDDGKFMVRYGNVGDRATVAKYPLDSYMDYDDRYPGTAPCGAFLANPWRIQDMLGNVWEWCQGPYQVDPTDPTTAVEGKVPTRGGSWWDTARVARCSNRNGLDVDQNESTLGMRIVLED